jgi:hypothetical protein
VITHAYTRSVKFASCLLSPFKSTVTYKEKEVKICNYFNAGLIVHCIHSIFVRMHYSMIKNITKRSHEKAWMVALKASLRRTRCSCDVRPPRWIYEIRSYKNLKTFSHHFYANWNIFPKYSEILIKSTSSLKIFHTREF